MTEEEVVASLSGAAVRLAPRQQLADGNVVSLGLEGEVVGGTEFRVRFVFNPTGRLVAVSLRTDPGRPSGVDAFEATRKAIAARLGAPGDATSDDAFIDLRQVTWRTRRTRIDVKYLPGVVVVLYTPAAAAPDARRAMTAARASAGARRPRPRRLAAERGPRPPPPRARRSRCPRPGTGG